MPRGFAGVKRLPMPATTSGRAGAARAAGAPEARSSAMPGD